MGSKNYELGGGGVAEPPPAMNASGFLLGVNGYVPDEQALTRMIGIHKSEEEPLVMLCLCFYRSRLYRMLSIFGVQVRGDRPKWPSVIKLTSLQGLLVRQEPGGLVVARILEGSPIAKQGGIIKSMMCSMHLRYRIYNLCFSSAVIACTQITKLCSNATLLRFFVLTFGVGMACDLPVRPSTSSNGCMLNFL